MELLTDKVKRLMKTKGISERKLAEQSGLNRGTIRHALSGGKIKELTACRIAIALETDIKKVVRK